jgi:hypothetical protein
MSAQKEFFIPLWLSNFREYPLLRKIEDHGSVAQNRSGKLLTAPSVYPISSYPHYEHRTITGTQAKNDQ